MAPRILVADDDPNLRVLLETILRDHGFDVTVVPSGEALVRAAIGNPPDLLLVDVMMPLMDGLEAIRQLRNDTRTGHLPMLLLTAQSTTRDVILGFESGADDYVNKPFDPEALVARIRANLRRQTRLPSLNPLTRLPGNTAIAVEVKRRLGATQPFAVLYIDFDNFKALNDAYGFARGDHVIMLLADVLRQQVAAFPGAFAGHLGGDDFVVLTDPEAFEPFCVALIERFDRDVRALYDQSDIERGYLRGVDRFGVPRRFPIVSLSIGVVNTATRSFASYDELSSVAAEMKGYAKKRSGSGFAVDGRSRDEPIPVDGERRGRPLCVVGVSPRSGFRKAVAALEEDGRCRTMLFKAAPTAGEIVSHGADVVALDLADDGCWQLAAALREQQPALPLLLSSPREGDETRAYGVGAYTFVAEPYPSDYLRACVAQLLRLNERFPPEG